MRCDRTNARHERSVPGATEAGPMSRSRCEVDPDNGLHRDTTDIRDRRDACPRNPRESPGTRQDAAFRKDATEAGVVATEGDDAAEDGATRSGGRRKAAHHE
jgi:hypothetical protein